MKTFWSQTLPLMHEKTFGAKVLRTYQNFNILKQKIICDVFPAAKAGEKCSMHVKE